MENKNNGFGLGSFILIFIFFAPYFAKVFDKPYILELWVDVISFIFVVVVLSIIIIIVGTMLILWSDRFPNNCILKLLANAIFRFILWVLGPFVGR